MSTGINFEKAAPGMEVEVKNTFSGKNPYYMLTSYLFVDFVRFNEEKLAQTFYKVARSIPTSMNSADYRFMISDDYARTLDRNFYQFKDTKSIGYDLLYNNSSTISLKSMQIEIFQRPYIRGKGITKARTIILKNKLSGITNSLASDEYFDYLLGVSTVYEVKTGDYVISFGTVPFETVKKYILPESKNDQVLVRIPNDEWSFISKTYRIHDPKTAEREERKNNILNTGLDNIYFELQRI
jgi:hypothetical protein